MKILSEHLLILNGLHLVKGFKIEGGYYAYLPPKRTDIDDIVVITHSQYIDMSNNAYSWLSKQTVELQLQQQLQQDK